MVDRTVAGPSSSSIRERIGQSSMRRPSRDKVVLSQPSRHIKSISDNKPFVNFLLFQHPLVLARRLTTNWLSIGQLEPLLQTSTGPKRLVNFSSDGGKTTSESSAGPDSKHVQVLVVRYGRPLRKNTQKNKRFDPFISFARLSTQTGGPFVSDCVDGPALLIVLATGPSIKNQVERSKGTMSLDLGHGMKWQEPANVQLIGSWIASWLLMKLLPRFD